MNPLNSSEPTLRYDPDGAKNAIRMMSLLEILDKYPQLKEEYEALIAKHTQEAYKKGYADKGIEELLKHENDKGNQV